MSADRSSRTFDATPARKQKAKREGRVVRSGEVTAIASFASAILVAFAVIPAIAAAMHDLLVSAAPGSSSAAPAQFAWTITLGLMPAVAAAGGAVLASTAQAGGVTFHLSTFDLKHLVTSIRSLE